jgi:cell division protein FtsI/penicillin-binding protein 2
LRQEEIPASHGNDIVLTIDKNVQYMIEQALSNALKEYDADSGMIIVQKVDTGEILGMATLPSFPPEKYGLFPKNLWKNIAISRNFEPGSVMKPLVVAMAIEHGIITKDSVFDLKSPWYYAGRPLSDHIQPGPHNIRSILAKSSNIGTALIGLEMARPNRRLGIKEEYHLLWASFRALGFGQLSGIDLVGEERGILPHYSKWSKLSPTRMPIGQGIAVTGIQLCTAYSALANGGKLMRPMIVLEERGHVDPTQPEKDVMVKRYEPEVRGRPFSAKTGRAVVDLLTSVVEKDPRVKGYPWSGGTGRRAQLPSYVVAGKTGTAQIPVNGHYSQKDYNASFVGMYPATDPKITILVTIERPKGARHTGGNVSAPVFASVAEDLGNYLYLPADKVLEDKK